MNRAPSPPGKPRLRGVSHLWGCAASLVSGAVAIAIAEAGTATWIAAVYALSVTSLLGVSGVYHWVNWEPARRAWMRRLDHTMIFVLIAGSYTPFAVYVLDEGSRTWVLVTVWALVAAAFIVNLGLQNAPHWFHAALSIAGSLAGVATFPQIVSNAGWPCMSLILVGGVFYIFGAVCYAAKRPNPIPGVFGYHEIFHVMVILAIGAHYAAIVSYALPLSA